MKKIAALLLALTLLCACSQPRTESSDTSSAEQTVLRVFVCENAQGIAEICSIYNEKNPDTLLTVIEADPNDDFTLAAKALMAGDRYPTLMLIPSEHLHLLLDSLSDLSSEGWINTAVPNTLNETHRGGKPFAVPAEIEGIGLLYDKEILSYLGINPENINSLERLEKTAELIDRKISEGKLRDRFPNLTAVFEKPNGKTEEYLSATSQSTNEPPLLSLMLEYCAADPLDNITNHCVAIALESHKLLDKASQNDKTFAETLGILPVPTESASQDSIIINVPAYWAVNKSSADAEIKKAKKFLSWLFNSEEGQTLTAEKMSAVSALPSCKRLPDNPFSEQVKNYAETGKTLPLVSNKN